MNLLTAGLLTKAQQAKKCAVHSPPNCSGTASVFVLMDLECIVVVRPTPLWLLPGRSASLYLQEINSENHAKPSLKKVEVQIEAVVSRLILDFPTHACYADGLFVMTTATDHKNNLNRAALKKNNPRSLRVETIANSAGGTAQVAVVAQPSIGFLNGRFNRDGTPTEDTEDCLGRITVGLTRSKSTTVLISPLDMLGLMGMAQVLAAVAYGIKGVRRGQTTWQWPNFSLDKFGTVSSRSGEGKEEREAGARKTTEPNAHPTKPRNSTKVVQRPKSKRAQTNRTITPVRRATRRTREKETSHKRREAPAR